MHNSNHYFLKANMAAMVEFSISIGIARAEIGPAQSPTLQTIFRSGLCKIIFRMSARATDDTLMDKLLYIPIIAVAVEEKDYFSLKSNYYGP